MKPRNFVAKHLGVNRSQVFVDRKKEAKAGVYKHQAYLEHKHMEELYSFDKYRGYCIAIEQVGDVYEAVVYDAKTHEARLTSTFHCPEELLEECKLMIDEVLEDE
jgi:hypothetical protein